MASVHLRFPDGSTAILCGIPAPPANPLPRQRCPRCGTDRPLRGDGTFRQHDAYDPPTGRSLGRCPATGLTPEQARAATRPLPGMDRR